jgi:hypothetical protein
MVRNECRIGRKCQRNEIPKGNEFNQRLLSLYFTLCCPAEKKNILIFRDFYRNLKIELVPPALNFLRLKCFKKCIK